MPRSQSPGSFLMVAEAGAENAEAVAELPGLAVAGTVANDGREDLTVFFSIGLVIDVLLVTAFLVWAVGQWRKKK
jgi:hypothetical protein